MPKTKSRTAPAVRAKSAAKESPSPRCKRRESTAKRDVNSSLCGVAKQPTTLEDARREMLHAVCANAGAITQAIVEDALQGKYLSARFLFKAVGLCDVKGGEPEELAERESLARLLLERWQLTAPTAGVTEVPDVTAEVVVPARAAVES